jgi:ATP-dependent 26S proteasome regulatory subunit
METFDGLAVLASNLRANIDEAFARRLSLLVDFPQPDVAQRLALWHQHLKRLPLDDAVDHDFCADAFELTGGNIRNIAVTAGYLASANGRVVTMEHVIRAVHLEYRKLGRLCLEAEFGPYFHHVRSVDRTVRT